MAETKNIFRFFDEQGNKAFVDSADVFDRASGKSAADHIADVSVHHTQAQINTLITSATEALKAGDIATLQSNLSSLESVVNAFMNGEPDGGTIDRLKELVAAIESNKGSIDALVADHVKKSAIVNDLTTGGVDKVLAAEQGKALKALLDALRTEFDAQAGHTGIAIMSSADATPVYNGKIRIVVESVVV